MAARTGFANALKRLLTGSYSATFVPDIPPFLYANVCIANPGEGGMNPRERVSRLPS